MAKTYVFDTIGGFGLDQGQEASCFYDVEEKYGNMTCTWQLSAIPNASLDELPFPEQQVQVSNISILRKGPGPFPNRIQINWKTKNIGKHHTNGRFAVSAISNL